MSRPPLAHLAWSKAGHGLAGPSLEDSAVFAPDLSGLDLPDPRALPRPDDLLPALERALAARVGAPGGRVLVTAGASEANACAFAGLLEPGEEALVERPGYEPHHAAPAWLGLAVRTFERRRERGYGGLAAEVEAALSAATRLVVLTDLHNPSGVPLSEADADALEDLAARRGFRLLCDETFRDASRRPAGTLAARSPRWVTTSTLTKSYGLGSLRVGWLAGPADALARCAEAQNALSVEPSGPSLALALALVPHLDALRARARGILDANHAGWRAGLVDLPCDANVPSEGTTTFVRFRGTEGGDAFAAFAAERFRLRVVPGRFFGDPRGVRVALGQPPPAFAAALDTFRAAVLAFDGERGGAREDP